MGRISELPSAESLSDDDLLVLVQGGRTKKISRILEILKEKIGTKLVNNLLATEDGKAALDAAMGKVLADRCADLETEVATLNGKIPLNYEEIGSGTIFERVASTNTHARYYINNGYKPDDAPPEFIENLNYEGFLEIKVDATTNRKQLVLFGCYDARGKIWVSDSWQGSEIKSKWTCI